MAISDDECLKRYSASTTGNTALDLESVGLSFDEAQNWSPAALWEKPFVNKIPRHGMYCGNTVISAIAENDIHFILLAINVSIATEIDLRTMCNTLMRHTSSV